jgi:hypothetical protein
MSTFSLAMHAASDGDALILTWGESPTLHHALWSISAEPPTTKP